MLAGYGLAALTKPLFPLATGIGAVLTARFVDRIGKGIRGAPRDALIADITPQESRGAAYGLRQSMDTVGAFAGPLLAIVLMAATHDNFRLVFWVAVVPAIVCVLVIIFGVDEPKATRQATQTGFPISRENLRRLPTRFWWVVVFAAVLTLARFSEAFLLLRAQNLGLAVTWVPMVLIVMNLVYAASAYPFGKLSDNGSRPKLLAWGIVFLILADLVLAAAGDIWTVGCSAPRSGACTWARPRACSPPWSPTPPPPTCAEPPSASSTSPAESPCSPPASSPEALWNLFGPAMTFITGAFFSVVALIGLVVNVRRNRHNGHPTSQ